MTSKEYQADYYKKNKERVLLRNKKYRSVHKEECKASNRQHHEKHYEDRLEYQRRYMFNLTREEHTKLLKKQDWRCANLGCENPVDYHSPLDHDHTCCPVKSRTCGKCTRGILCQSCNKALGYLEDNMKKILGLGQYLKGAKQDADTNNGI